MVKKCKNALINIKLKPLKSGNPNIIIPIIAKGVWPKTTEVILSNLSLEPRKIKFQKACKNAAHKTIKIINVSVIC